MVSSQDLVPIDTMHDVRLFQPRQTQKGAIFQVKIAIVGLDQGLVAFVVPQRHDAKYLRKELDSLVTLGKRNELQLT